ncbi:hypothetical protein [Sinomonas humi]|uniref:hypothetical protein n=1 Tax=Sinomonas humi TaxID=1338436 RepID=UPI0005BD4FE6|nr:hypothetical protein [Sinomonas humi]
MENLLPPLIILLCVVVIVVLMLRRGARRSKSSGDAALAGGLEAAAAASSRLSEHQHRVIYSFIAQGLTVQAIAAYRQATGARLIEARNAVLLMDRYPQSFNSPPAETTRPAPGPQTRPPGAPDEDATGEPSKGPAERTEPETTSSTPAVSQRREEASPSSAQQPKVPATLGERSTTRYPYRYRAIVSNGRQTLEVASNLLNDEIYGEIKALAQIGDAEDAAQMLWRHSDISIEEARAFVELL